MPNSATKKIVSAHKFALLGGALFVAGTVAVLLTSIVVRRDTTPVLLHVANKTYQLTVVRTAADQEKGLGGRVTLPQNQGMLFAYHAEGTRCFWMKDTHFPLDMVWVDGQKRVRHIEHDISPTSYPATFCPRVPAQYVIELNAGEAARARMQNGETLVF